ncbi:PREDICTED: protein NRT1/ PTR FAMILY 2.11-like [Ipomoea nil]|uniref:protein NRT1/ PTR FAMILY 2.11-like n=1 Tax=Ipomoea nil TaxID=35883 RepID=UPI0009008AB4|nr:PREDICTED: protein NRT1/ PTR FAMILY 2.11-like [Ipomoea nil]XP_019152315.1 PREDICTED: protein NRT1/ PTR FAMILY 2.11-like [Ipomoea nil]XP_019152316.1 PREDICTED: protein NRT1/ PTR FAMILY 2.11-like [Ipomoea nil]
MGETQSEVATRKDIKYRGVVPEGSPFKSVAQVLVAAFKKRRLDLPQHSLSLFHHAPSNSLNSRLPFTNQFRCLSKAAIIRTAEDAIKEDGAAENPWRLCSVQQVEEVKCLLKILPIWGAGVIYYISVVQAQNFVVFQAIQSDRRLGGATFQIPPASFIVFAMLSITIWLPIYDRLILPILRKHTNKEDGITLLQKMGIGIFLSVITMVASAIVETRRRTLAAENEVSSMSALWLIPQMALSGLSEAFALIGENEFFYRQCPENMRSIAASFLFVGLAGSSYLSSFLTSVVHRTTGWLAQDLNQGRLDYFYHVVAALEMINLIYFLACAKWYKYKGNTNTP